jgi:hypothetical protein
MHMLRHRRHIMKDMATALALAAWFLPACEKATATGPPPPLGNQTFVLSYSEFVATVNPILSQLGCDNMNCHGGGDRAPFALSPPGNKDPARDFEQARLQVFPPDPAQSPLLLEPLAAECGGTDHAGGAFFFSFEDPGYVAILTWIENGEYR